LGTAAFVAFLTSLPEKKYAGTQYALLSSVMAIGRTLAGVPAGYLAANLSWPVYFAVCTCLATPGLTRLWWLRRIDAISSPPTAA
jgi:PAT family beta-lactamase induction signal transducer AmpG